MLAGENKKKTILVVDEDEHAANVLARLLVQAGYDVVTMKSGEAALEWLDGATADLIFVDDALSGISGLALCRWLRQRSETRTTPIVLLGERTDIAGMVESQQAGSDLYLGKPLLAARLLTMIGTFLSETGLARRRNAYENS